VRPEGARLDALAGAPQRLAEPRVQLAQRRLGLQRLHHQQPARPRRQMTELEIEWLERLLERGHQLGQLRARHRTEEVQRHVPARRTFARGAGGPADRCIERAQPGARAVVGPQRDEQAQRLGGRWRCGRHAAIVSRAAAVR